MSSADPQPRPTANRPLWLHPLIIAMLLALPVYYLCAHAQWWLWRSFLGIFVPFP